MIEKMFGETPEEKEKQAAQEVLLEPVPEEKTYTFPPVNLLEEPKTVRGGNTQKELRANADLLVDTLRSFGQYVYFQRIPLFYQDIENEGLICPVCGSKCRCGAQSCENRRKFTVHRRLLFCLYGTCSISAVSSGMVLSSTASVPICSSAWTVRYSTAAPFCSVSVSLWLVTMPSISAAVSPSARESISTRTSSAVRVVGSRS